MELFDQKQRQIDIKMKLHSHLIFVTLRYEMNGFEIKNVSGRSEVEFLKVRKLGTYGVRIELRHGLFQ